MLCCLGSVRKAGRLLLCTVPILLFSSTSGRSAEIGVSTGSVYQRWMGFDPWAPTIGVDLSSPNFSNTFWWSSARKSYVGNGWSAWEQAAAYFNHGAFGVGPSALVRYTSNDQFTKTSFYPSVAFQCRTPKWRVETFIHFRDPLTLNHGRGAAISVRRELNPGNKSVGLAFKGEITLLKFSDGLPDRYGSITQFGLVVYHRSVE